MAITSHLDALTPGMKARIDPASRFPKRVSLLQSSHVIGTIAKRILLNKPTRTTYIKNHPNINRAYR